MKKYIFTLIFFTIFSANAQTIDVSEYVNSIQMSKEFLSHLATCTPYEEDKSAGIVNVETGVSYKVIGPQADGKCEVRIDSQAVGMNINAYQICSFSKENLNEFVPAMLNLLKRKTYTLENMAEMFKDENYLTAMGIMMDEDICKIHRDAIDMTKNVREKLRNCESYTETQKLGPTELTRQIVGKSDELCIFNIHVLQKKPDFGAISGKLAEEMKELVKDMPERYFDIKCKLSESEVSAYINILEAQIVPAIDGMNDIEKGFENINPRAETDFLDSHCETVFPDLP